MPVSNTGKRNYAEAIRAEAFVTGERSETKKVAMNPTFGRLNAAERPSRLSHGREL